MYRSWGGDVIGMTNLQEAKLAREAEICFATLAMATDYDCWRDSGESVAVDDILAVLNANADLARSTVREAAGSVVPQRDCGCRRALDNAVITAPEAIDAPARERLALVAGRVL